MINATNKKAILINTETQEITEVLVRDIKHIRNLIGNDCSLFEPVMLDDNNDLMIDENGLNKNPEHFFYFKGLVNPLAGNAVLLGWDKEKADSTDTNISIEWVKNNIRFMNKRDIAVWVLANS